MKRSGVTNEVLITFSLISKLHFTLLGILLENVKDVN